MRCLPFVASFCCSSAIILALQVLLAGVGNGWFESAAIITYNTSALGLSEFYQVNSTLHSNVTALVPSSITNPTSITQFLGIQDWYSIHYFSTCSGSFARSSENGGVQTSQKTNITCVKQTSGYSFTISDILRKELHPSVAAIADDVTQAKQYTAPWIILWYIGLISAIVEIFTFLPLTWCGTRRLNGYSTILCFISELCFQLASTLAANHSLRAHHSQNLPPVLYATAFFAMTWTTMCLMLVAFILVQVEWRFELWTLKGEPITIYRKPKCKSWFLLQALWDRNPAKIDAIQRDEEYEIK